MGKLRDFIADDCVGIAQWVGRKFNNHLPMSQRDQGESANRRTVKVQGGAYYVKSDRTKIRMVLHDGREFEVSVREVFEEEDLAEEKVSIYEAA